MDEENNVLSMLRWGNTAIKAKNVCIKNSLSILWTAWNVHKSYRTVEMWCNESYQWKKEDMINKVGPMVLSEMCNVSHPAQLSDEAAELVIRNLINDMPSSATSILERIIHAPYTTCYYDIVLTDSVTTKLVCELTFLVKSFLHIIQSTADNIIAISVKERKSHLRKAKKSFKEARKRSFHHKPVLDQTIKDLKIAECRIQERLHKCEGQTNRDKIKYKHSTVTTPCNSDAHNIELSTFSNHSLISEDEITSDNDENRLVDDKINLLTSSNNSLSGILNPIPIEVSEDSYSDNSVDEEIRTRLDSNASAEKTKLNILEIVDKCRMHVNIARDGVKSFRDRKKSFVTFVDSCITETLDILQSSTNLKTESEFNEASERIDIVRQSTLGKYIHRVRQSCQSCILKRHMVLDIIKWLNEFSFDRHLVDIISPLRIINKTTSVRCSFKQILPLTETVKFLLLVGPAGSGKTFTTKFLLNHWNKNSKIIDCPFDYDALIPITSSFFSSKISLADHISEVLTINASTDLLNTIPSSYFSKMRLLFIAELDNSSSIKKIQEYIEDVNRLNDGTKTIITCRNENSKTVESLIQKLSSNIHILEILCLDEPLLVKFVHYYVDDETSVREFCALYEALNLEANLRHPLFVLLSMYLWRKGPSFLAPATCLSKLIMSTMVEFHLRASDYHNQKFNVDIEKSHCWADECVKALCESVWQEESSNLAVKEELDGLTEVTPPLSDQQELFHPFLIFVDNRCYLAHPALKELISGVYLAGKICQRQRSIFSCCCNPLRENKLNLNKASLSIECLIVASGIWSLTENLQQSIANKLASLYSTLAAGSPILWLRFVSESGQSKVVSSAVSNQLLWKSVWNSSNFSLEENVAVSELIRIEAYHPNKVIIEEGCPGVVELVNSLALCQSVHVILRMEQHFYSWDDSDVCDDLVELLQPAGNLIELWAHLDSGGTRALRHMKNLRDLNIRITSADALLALSTVLPKLPLLRFLSLRFNLPPDVRSSIVPSFSEFKGEFWLRFNNITDDKYECTLEVIKNLQLKPLEIHLHHSHLTPDVLQEFKINVGTGNVYISM